MHAFRAFIDWAVPVEFLSLCKASAGEAIDRARNSNTLLNAFQCEDLLSKLVETIENVTALVSNCGDPATPFTPALRNLYQISEKAKRLVSNCSDEKLCEASLIFQLQNDKAFQEILLDLGLCYNVVFEQAKSMRGGCDPQIRDLRESSTFSPATIEEVLEDQERLQERLQHLAKYSSNAWEKCLANYLLRKSDSSPEHGQAKELDVSTSPILWVKETEPPGTWKYEGLLGSGSGASGVCRTQWLGIPCAKKEFHTDVEMAIFVREVGIISCLSHPNIVCFFCCSNGPEKGQCFIGMELMQMSLSDLIGRTWRKPLPLSVALDIIVQIARGMHCLHGFGIAHRDLKPSNVVVNRLNTPHLDDNFCVKLVDFGMSKTKVEVSKSNTISIPGVGTTRYRAPEVHPKAHHNPKQGNKQGHAKVVWFKADVYSFGVTCAEILSSRPPFEGIAISELYGGLVRGARPKLPSHCPEKLVSLLEDCWNGAPRSRPTFADICTRLEVVRYDLLRDSTPVAHGGWQEAGIDPMGYDYIKMGMLKNQEAASITNLLNGLSRLDTLQEEADSLHFAGLDQEKVYPTYSLATRASGEGSEPSSAMGRVPLDRESVPLSYLHSYQERTYPQQNEILGDMQGEVRRPRELVGLGRGTLALETHHGEVGPSMPPFVEIVPSSFGPHDTSLQIPCVLIKDPKNCQTTKIALPYDMQEVMLHYMHQGDLLVLWNKRKKRSTIYMLEVRTHGTQAPRSSWQILYEGVNIPHGGRDCKDGKDGMCIVEATSTSIVFYDVLDSKVKCKNFKAWSPLQNIKGYDKVFTIHFLLPRM